MERTILIGGAWPYANNSLHIGHLAALLPGDVLARYFRQNGDKVYYVSGSDCHGTPITIRANKNGVKPSEIAEHYHNEFVENFSDLGFSYDLYSSTMTKTHHELVQKFLKKIDLNGYLYTAYEDNYFCPHCGKIIVDREVVGRCPKCGGEANGEQCDACLSVFKVGEIENAKCKYCQTPVEIKNGKHLYFRMSDFTEIIKQYIIENSKEYNWRQTAINESLKYVNEGLKDRAITRDLTWGIEVPFEGFDDKRIYVWFEAVMGYFTDAITLASKEGKDFLEIAKLDNFKSYYVHGKDNIVFHTVILPALLEAIDPKINKPNCIISCEYINMNNVKMSKSKGNLVTVNNLISNFYSDSIRYFFIRFNPERKDASFSYSDFVDCHNKQLLGGYGNFVNRNLSFLKKKYEGKLPKLILDDEIKNEVQNWYNEIATEMERGELKTVAEKFYSYVQFANAYYDKSKPWTLYENFKEDFDKITSNCIYLICNLANISAMILPKTSDKISKWLGFETNKFQPVSYSVEILPDIEPLFARLELDKIDSEVGSADTFNK